MVKTFALLFVFSVAAQAQFGLGLKIGVPPTDAFKAVQTRSVASAQHFLIGPYVELPLPGGNSIEIDALRRRYNFPTAGQADSWEFPVLLKHRIGQGMARPFFAVGAAFSRLSDIQLSTLKHRENYGLVVGGGVDIKFLFFRLSPEVRYSAWAVRNFDGVGIQSNRSQVAILMGVGF